VFVDLIVTLDIEALDQGIKLTRLKFVPSPYSSEDWVRIYLAKGCFEGVLAGSAGLKADLLLALYSLLEMYLMVKMILQSASSRTLEW